MSGAAIPSNARNRPELFLAHEPSVVIDDQSPRWLPDWSIMYIVHRRAESTLEAAAVVAQPGVDGDGEALAVFYGTE